MYAVPPFVGITYWRSPAGGTHARTLVVHVLPLSFDEPALLHPSHSDENHTVPSLATARSGSKLGMGSVGAAIFVQFAPPSSLANTAPPSTPRACERPLAKMVPSGWNPMLGSPCPPAGSMTLVSRARGTSSAGARSVTAAVWGPLWTHPARRTRRVRRIGPRMASRTRRSPT